MGFIIDRAVVNKLLNQFMTGASSQWVLWIGFQDLTPFGCLEVTFRASISELFDRSIDWSERYEIGRQRLASWRERTISCDVPGVSCLPYVCCVAIYGRYTIPGSNPAEAIILFENYHYIKRRIEERRHHLNFFAADRFLWFLKHIRYIFRMKNDYNNFQLLELSSGIEY